MYVGRTVMSMLSKWVHMAGMGFARRPWAKVSAARRKLKSLGTKGSGAGKSGRMATRKSSAEKPTVATARNGLRARRRKMRSMRPNQDEPSRGATSEITTAKAVRPPSASSKVDLLSDGGERNMTIPDGQARVEKPRQDWG